jgi:hypothetical protein
MRLKLGKCLNLIQNCNFLSTCIYKSLNICRANNNNLPTELPIHNSKPRKQKKQITFNRYLHLINYTLFYNEQNDAYGLMEAIFLPFIDCCSRFVRLLGIFLVCLVWVLLVNMIYVFYTIITPELYLNTSMLNFLIHFLFGNLLAVNTVFHYFMGLVTNPGNPEPQQSSESKTLFTSTYEPCKKCHGPKPPRTHHCSICNKCVLKMVIKFSSEKSFFPHFN